MVRPALPRCSRRRRTQGGQSLSDLVQDRPVLARPELVRRRPGIELPAPQDRDLLRPTQPDRPDDLIDQRFCDRSVPDSYD